MLTRLFCFFTYSVIVDVDDILSASSIMFAEPYLYRLYNEKTI